ncbi:putative Fe-S oxidoreductase [Archaeoglobus sulfaticallidus PM70-1]|uniref:Putative Fe-S oxidoreductase n=1 Tax=Archaeoglobus sulfaticallidus PM70-1 TaxID=387631 RepID=N0BNQ1_9EURY|nr:radical SAM protein [Archaeoglobus sulfaticallidus]AGK61955.1 putative Fe-S oxidoreductase [Archaeoglobus sulfaticallidus PM70-1]
MMLKEYEERGDKVFLLRGIVEVRIPIKAYERLIKRKDKEYIISFGEPRKVLNHITKRELVFVTKESGIPLLGSSSFGLIDRGTNLIQVRPITGCNLRCIFCSVDEGKKSKTRATDYIVDPDYLVEVLKQVVEFKGEGVEVHIDGQGEPLLYPYMEDLLSKISKIKGVSIISMQTNGILLNESKISALEEYVTRFNLSLSSLDRDTASRLSGIKYPVERVTRNAEMIANSKADLLIAPVWVPGINDRDIEKIIEFALEINAGKRFPPLGIQKYIPYKYGRKLKKVMTFKEFYDRLRKWEEEYGVKLILKPEDFGMDKRSRIPHPIKKGEMHSGRIVANGRLFGERMVAVRDRVVTIRCDKRVGDHVKFRITADKDGIFYGEVV